MGRLIFPGLAMNMLRIMSRPAFAIIGSLLLGTAAHAFTDEAVKDAEALLGQINDRFKAGEVERIDLEEAKYHLVEMKFRAGQIQRPAFCQEAVPNLQAIVSGVLGESRVGQATTEDLIRAKRRLYKITGLCRQG
jgi:hypothetical protein